MKSLDRAILATVSASDLSDADKRRVRRIMWGFRPMARQAIRNQVALELSAAQLTLPEDDAFGVDLTAIIEFIRQLLPLILELIDLFND